MIKAKNQNCVLIGEKLSHSFSPMIHSHLADYPYSLAEIRRDELEAFVKSDKYTSANVTIPYKVAVMEYLDEISDEARAIGCVNCITHTPDGKLRGDNTDFYGLSYLIKSSGIDVSGKKVLILGSGGSFLTARAVCNALGASEIICISRQGEVNYDNVYSLHGDADIIINTSPVGMFPNNLECKIDLEKFKSIKGVFDIVFNPSKTKLLLDAEKLSVPAFGGLTMLVGQAKKACEIFTGEQIPDSEIDRIKKIIEDQTLNIILVGMPGCGKSTIAKALAEELNREIIDTDEEIVKNAKMPIPEIFSTFGEGVFRSLEHNEIKNAGKQSGKIISTGGGAVTIADNYEPLHQNGIIVFIKRDTDKLSRFGRPLSIGADLNKMYEKRLPLYEKFADIVVENDSDITTCVEKIITLFRGRK